MDMASSSSSSSLKSASMSNNNHKAEEGGFLNDMSTESSVTCTYQAMVGKSLRNIAVTWAKVSTCHSLSITIENHTNDEHQTFHIEFQSTQFWSRKGFKSIQVDGERVDVFWDLRAVKFLNNPEPCSGYYVALVSNKKMVLLLGDNKEEAYKRTSLNPHSETQLLHKEEILIGNKCFQTRMLLDDGPKEHEIVIENLVLKSREPELRISIDGKMHVRVMNLNWRFRGNETALVNNVPIQIFWDVHDWLFSSPNGSGSGSGFVSSSSGSGTGTGPSSSRGLFIFQPGSLKDALRDEHKDHWGDHNDREEDNDSTTHSNGCCHYVFAFKVSNEGG